ncbi:uncharacterized protein [Diabrotica undecimpunctata]|uniref:uncharacterized protein n=1 Tax=Diabrotica undecimpunctata TaxID=50387 RepID=UPI003B63B30A
MSQYHRRTQLMLDAVRRCKSGLDKDEEPEISPHISTLPTNVNICSTSADIPADRPDINKVEIPSCSRILHEVVENFQFTTGERCDGLQDIQEDETDVSDIFSDDDSIADPDFIPPLDLPSNEFVDYFDDNAHPSSPENTVEVIDQL